MCRGRGRGVRVGCVCRLRSGTGLSMRRSRGAQPTPIRWPCGTAVARMRRNPCGSHSAAMRVSHLGLLNQRVQRLVYGRLDLWGRQHSAAARRSARWRRRECECCCGGSCAQRGRRRRQHQHHCSAGAGRRSSRRTRCEGCDPWQGGAGVCGCCLTGVHRAQRCALPATAMHHQRCARTHPRRRPLPLARRAACDRGELHRAHPTE